jgi:hypothetical protein
MSGNSLINLGELSKPATVLIEKISDAIGVLYEPRHIRNVARAEADAARIRVQSEIEVSDVQRRAVQRWVTEEGKKQENIESITWMALPDVGDTAETERIEADWITNFFEKARLISDAEMQTLWAKVLAGEANDPGTYSKRTVGFLASLDREDARLFSALCGFCWTIGSHIPLVFDVEKPVYAKAGIDYAALAHLADIGLIRYQHPTFALLSGFKKRARVGYYDEVIELEFEKDSDKVLQIGHVQLSKVGMELAPLCGSTAVPGFLEHALTEWRNRAGVISSSPLPRCSPVDRAEDE